MMCRSVCRAGMIATVTVVVAGCGQVHDRSYLPFEKDRDGHLLRIAVVLTEGGALRDGKVAARAYSNVYSTRSYDKMRVNRVRILSKKGQAVFSCSDGLSSVETKSQYSSSPPYVGRFSFKEQLIDFVDYNVEASVDLLDKSGAIVESFDVKGVIKAHTVSRPKWLPY